MRIAIVGDGRMGRAVAAVAAEWGNTVSVMLGVAGASASGLTASGMGNPDVAVEFTSPSSAPGNILGCVRAGIPVVTGTTGWYDRLDEVSEEVLELGGSMLWSPNFSVGVAVLTAAAEAAAAAVRLVGGFDAFMVETHHAAKRDRPSGTAAALSAAVRRALGHEVPVTSVRGGHVPGTHEVVFDATYEQVRFVHEVRDRRVFAAGALAAAAWILGRKGVFTMQDVIRLNGDHR